MGEKVLGVPLPEEPRKRFYRVISPKGQQRLRVTLLAETWVGFWVHWDTCVIPCCRTHECRMCKSGNGHRWQAYIACWDLVKHERAVLALSEGAARQLLDMRHAEGGLRGLSIELSRKFPTKNNSSLRITEIGYQRPEDVFGAHPVMDSLNRLFGLNEKFQARIGQELPQEFAVNEDVPLPDEKAARPTPPREQKATPAGARPPVIPTALSERFKMPPAG